MSSQPREAEVTQIRDLVAIYSNFPTSFTHLSLMFLFQMYGRKKMKARKENVGFGHSVAKMVPLVIGLRYFIDLRC
jgi:hypothetical protein